MIFTSLHEILLLRLSFVIFLIYLLICFTRSYNFRHCKNSLMDPTYFNFYNICVTDYSPDDDFVKLKHAVVQMLMG
jgi:hypothetical protein